MPSLATFNFYGPWKFRHRHWRDRAEILRRVPQKSALLKVVAHKNKLPAVKMMSTLKLKVFDHTHAPEIDIWKIDVNIDVDIKMKGFDHTNAPERIKNYN